MPNSVERRTHSWPGKTWWLETVCHWVVEQLVAYSQWQVFRRISRTLKCTNKCLRAMTTQTNILETSCRTNTNEHFVDQNEKPSCIIISLSVSYLSHIVPCPKIQSVRTRSGPSSTWRGRLGSALFIIWIMALTEKTMPDLWSHARSNQHTETTMSERLKLSIPLCSLLPVSSSSLMTHLES